ncbi:hypothetical protein Q9Q99_07205 [Curtobacterium flaccumfaciens]|nr:hypothetical protein Q9Q99_07205 [Curtobacterium flaccumfaciens]
MSTQLVALVEAPRSCPMVDSAGATSDCRTAKDRPPRDRETMIAVLFGRRPFVVGCEPVRGLCMVSVIVLRVLVVDGDVNNC